MRKNGEKCGLHNSYRNRHLEKPHGNPTHPIDALDTSKNEFKNTIILWEFFFGRPHNTSQKKIDLPISFSAVPTLGYEQNIVQNIYDEIKMITFLETFFFPEDKTQLFSLD